MKKLYFLLMGLFLFSGVSAQVINFPDANFKAKLLAAWPSNFIARDVNGNGMRIDVNNDNQISVSEALNVYQLDLTQSTITNLTGLDYFTNLIKLNTFNNQIAVLNVSNLTNMQSLKCAYNQLTSLDLSGLVNLQILDCSSNQIITLNNLTGLTNLQNLNCGNNRLSNLNLTGLINLDILECSGNQLTILNLGGLNIIDLRCSGNQITNLDPSGMNALRILYCTDNLLSTLNISGLNNLYDLWCRNNNLTSLNVTGRNSLYTIECGNNLITNLDFTGCSSLNSIHCANNQLSSLSFGILNNLGFIDCSHNQLTTLDISGCMNVYNILCNNNILRSLFLKNGTYEGVTFSNNLTLRYICADESQLVNVQNLISQYNYTNCNINSYCSFTPGGTFYTIQGNDRFDSNNNGCDVSDVLFPNLKLNITNGTISGSTISNTSGNYTIPVQSGTHTITPVLENPSYYTISPTTVSVTFPTTASPFTQNFCVTANGVHPDLEVLLLQIVPARPGVDAKYKIIYKNKGNTTQSGSLNLAFNDMVLDFVTANPVVSNQTINNLSWNFSNLLPFETREITLTLNVNSPMESPAVNGGDVLNYTTTVASAPIDETPNDNTFTFNQTVVNAFDPNDKTCLEGATIAPAKVGDYVHYIIRFENNGTANAQNIVVKDMIDLSKFDVNTLVPIKGSHSFVTNITSGNKVEFIFEGINLPFDDANNDGYVAFKIKTKATLVPGDTFSNTASIYFDYNFPIVTNTATTTIAVLATQDFVFSNYFNVYPNPVKDILNITAKEAIEATSINIYNTLGQLVLVIPNAQNTNTVDVSGLTKGNYFIKINSDKGTSNTKFIKN